MLRIRIRDPVPFDPWIRDPGWVKIKIRIRDEHPGSYFREFKTNFWVKILTFFDVDGDPDPGIFLTIDPGSGMEKNRYGIHVQYFHVQSPPYLESLSSAPVIQVLSPPISST